MKAFALNEESQNRSIFTSLSLSLCIKYNIISSFVWLDIYVICGSLAVLNHHTNPQISLNSLTSALPFLSLCTSLSLSLPPQISIHSDSVWNMIALVVIIGAFTMGIALCSTQYSDWNVGLKYSAQHSRTKCAIEESWVCAHLHYISVLGVMPNILEIFCALDLLFKCELWCVNSQ